MRKLNRKEWIIGLWSIVILVSIILFALYLQGEDIFNRVANYYVKFPDVEGLYASNRVQYNGLAIGKVKDIHFYRENSDTLLVELQLPASFKLQAGTEASIANTGLIGGRVIILHNAKGHGPYLANLDTIPGRAKPSYAQVLEENLGGILIDAQALIRHIASLAAKLDQAITPEQAAAIGASIDNLRNTIERVDRASAAIPDIIVNTKQAMGQIASISNDAKAISASATRIIDSVEATQPHIIAQQLNASAGKLREIIQSIDSGKGTLGKLMNNDSLYNSTLRTIQSIDSLASDIKRNPKRYISIKVF